MDRVTQIAHLSKLCQTYKYRPRESEIESLVDISNSLLREHASKKPIHYSRKDTSVIWNMTVTENDVILKPGKMGIVHNSGGVKTAYEGIRLSTMERVAVLKAAGSETSRNFHPEALKRLRNDAYLSKKNLGSSFLASSFHSMEYTGSRKGRPIQKFELVAPLAESDLYSHLKKNTRPLDDDIALDFASHMAHGVRCLHQKNVAHRDIKPENFLVLKEHGKYRVKLTDFETTTELNDLDYKFGTFFYMAPEVSDSIILDQKFTPTLSELKKTDIYSLGISFFHLVINSRSHPLSHAIYDAFSDDSFVNTMIAQRSMKWYYNQRNKEFISMLNSGRFTKTQLKILQLSQKMTLFNPEKRPDIESVLIELQSILHSVEKSKEERRNKVGKKNSETTCLSQAYQFIFGAIKV